DLNRAFGRKLVNSLFPLRSFATFASSAVSLLVLVPFRVLCSTDPKFLRFLRKFFTAHFGLHCFHFQIRVYSRPFAAKRFLVVAPLRCGKRLSFRCDDVVCL